MRRPRLVASHLSDRSRVPRAEDDAVMTTVHIVVATDCSDFASTEIKMALLSAFRKRNLSCATEVVHTQEFSIENAAFVLRQLAEYSPPGTVFMPVVNAEPSEQARVIGRTRDRD